MDTHQTTYLTNPFKTRGAFSWIILHFQIQNRISGLRLCFSTHSLLLGNTAEEECEREKIWVKDSEWFRMIEKQKRP